MRSNLAYRKQLYENYSSNFNQPHQVDIHQEFNVFDQHYPTVNPASYKVLDLGCGRGFWMRWIQSKGCQDITGVDFGKSELEGLGQFSFKIHQKDILDYLAECSESFDIIHCKDVIEHLTKDEIVFLLIEASKRLKPEGEIWLSTFNALAPMSRHTLYGDFTHETSFTSESLHQLLNACGYRNLVIHSFHPATKTFRGFIRKLAYLPFVYLNAVLCILRYGSTGNISCFPTLFARAKSRL